MANRIVDYKAGTGATDDTGEVVDTAIKPIVNSDAIEASTTNRPHENIRKRTEVLRSKVEDLLYLADADRWTLMYMAEGENITLQNTKFTASNTIYIRPALAPILSAPAQITLGTGTGKIILKADTSLVAAPYPPRDYGVHASGSRVSANKISIDVTVGGSLSSTVDGTPADNLHLVVQAGTLASEVLTHLNEPLGVFKALGLTAVAGPGYVGGTVFSGAISTTYLTGGLDAEVHAIDNVEIDTFFADPDNQMTEGDVLAIWYEHLTNSGGTGGRRQSILELPENAGSAAVVTAGSLFLVRRFPERAINAIPICARIGTDWHFANGVVVIDGTLVTLEKAYVAKTGDVMSGRLTVAGGAGDLAAAVYSSGGGSTSVPGVEGRGGLTNGPGVKGTGRGTGAGVQGVGSGGNSVGVTGAGTGSGNGVTGTAGGSGIGVEGSSSATGAYGVKGTGFTVGVRGEVLGAATNGVGVSGVGKGTGEGVTGATSAGSAASAVKGTANSGAAAIGVEGVSTASASGVGVKGNGATTGVDGTGVTGVSGTGSTGDGVYGISSATDSSKAGVRGVGSNNTGGESAGVKGEGGTDGIGVIGVGNGAGSGMKGIGGDSGGTGVAGFGDAATGTPTANAGVYGKGGATGIGVDGVGNGTAAGVKGTATGSGPGVEGASASGYGVQATGNATRSALRVVPRAAPSTPAHGDIYAKDTAGKDLYYYDGTSWRNLSAYSRRRFCRAKLIPGISAASAAYSADVTQSIVHNPTHLVFTPLTGFVTPDVAYVELPQLEVGDVITKLMLVGDTTGDATNGPYNITVSLVRLTYSSGPVVLADLVLPCNRNAPASFDAIAATSAYGTITANSDGSGMITLTLTSTKTVTDPSTNTHDPAEFALMIENSASTAVATVRFFAVGIEVTR